MNATTNRKTVWSTGLVLIMTLMLTSVAFAAKGGKGGKDGGSGGGSSDITPARITFTGGVGYRITGDAFGAYIHGEDGVEAYIGTGGAEGDIFLRLAAAPSRDLWYDFSSCYPDASSCTPPFSAGYDTNSAIAVAPNDIVAGGLFGMTAGETIEAPMEFWYDFGGPQGPGFVYFDRELKGNNPCKNKSLFATVTRPGEAELWTVSADASTLACVALPGGDLSGQYDMTFRFTIEAIR